MAVAHVVRSTNRFELKYRIPRAMVGDLIDWVGAYVHADPHATDERGYAIQSVYCDSPDRALFWEKIEGLRFRRKVRFRSYGDGRHVFLEIKQRVDRTLQKRRSRWTWDRYEAAFLGERVPNVPELDAGELEDPVASEVVHLWNTYDLAPCMGISYRRRAFFADHEPDLRITFDSNVKYHARDLDLSRPLEDGKFLVDPDQCIMEVKFSDRVPIWLCKVLRAAEVQVMRFSKYCAAVDREYFRGTHT